MKVRNPQKALESELENFRRNSQIFNVGALGTVLVITRKAKDSGLPLDPDRLLTKGGGQVAGLSGRAINKILAEHGIERRVGTESGRTSRGTPNIARSYALFLNTLHNENRIRLDVIESGGCQSWSNISILSHSRSTMTRAKR